jgi:hypothetical protein
MRSRRKIVALALSAAVAVSLGGAGSPRTFKDCTALHKSYPNGIAKSAKAAAHPFPFWIRVRPPVVDANAYAANKKLDRDNDGLACEVGR